MPAPDESSCDGLAHEAHGRRSWLRQLGAGAAAWGLSAWAVPAFGNMGAGGEDHFPFGPLKTPRSIPAWPVHTHRRQASSLQALLRGRTTALQLMFTGCSATCPLQGALFAQLQRTLPAAGGELQLLSLSIDALGDTPVALAAWLQRFGAGPNWLAALPAVADIDRIFELLGSGGEARPAGSDPHTGQVYLINRRAELVMRTPSMPAAARVLAALRDTAERFPAA